MNKKTSLLALLGLVAVSGAGYFYTSGQTAQLPQQIAQFLPEAVRDYLPASFLPEPVVEKQAAEKQIADTEALATADEMAQEETGMDAEASQQNEEESTERVQIDSNVLDEMEQSVAAMDKASVQAANDNTVSKEIQDLQQRLQQVKSKIGGLDEEKLALEDKFQNVLKQNRSLAIKLSEIDEELKVNMEQ